MNHLRDRRFGDVEVLGNHTVGQAALGGGERGECLSSRATILAGESFRGLIELREDELDEVIERRTDEFALSSRVLAAARLRRDDRLDHVAEGLSSEADLADE